MSEPMRVLAVDAAGTGGRLYGGQKHILDLATRTRDCIDWTIAQPAAGGPYLAALAAAGLNTRRVALRAPLPLARAALARLVREGFDLVCTHDLRASAIARPVAARLGLPVLTTYHALLQPDFQLGTERWRRLRMLALDARTVGLCARCLCVSGAIADDLRATHRLAGSRIAVVPNGVDPAALQSAATPESVAAVRAELGVQPDRPLVVQVGELAVHKGQHVLIRAVPAVLRESPGALFVFVGDGPAASSLRAEAAGLGLASACRFVGYREPVAPWLAAAAVVAMPSLSEGQGLAAIEAAALGKPVVASDAGGLREVVLDGVTGCTTRAGDPGELAAALVRLLADPVERARLGAAGRRRVETTFTLARQAERTVRLYQSVLAEVGR